MTEPTTIWGCPIVALVEAREVAVPFKRPGGGVLQAAFHSGGNNFSTVTEDRAEVDLEALLNEIREAQMASYAEPARETYEEYLLHAIQNALYLLGTGRTTQGMEVLSHIAPSRDEYRQAADEDRQWPPNTMIRQPAPSAHIAFGP